MPQSENDIEACYRQAVELHGNGEFSRALRLYERVLSRFPDACPVLYNYALACYELGRFAEAADALQRAAQRDDGDADIHFNLGLAYKQCGRYERAVSSYRRALDLSPDDADTLYNLGCCYQEWGRDERAVLIYERLLALNPGHESALNNLAYLRHRRGDRQQARALYGRLLALCPDHAAARHMLAALSGRGEAAPPREYIRDLFDDYSATFDHNLLQRLEYRVPDLLRELLDEQLKLSATSGPVGGRFSRGLDLGCGTGLAGERFRSRCDFLAGVDLSAGMVSAAAEKQLYDELHTGDVVDFLAAGGRFYDLLLAADLFTYLGDLTPLLQAAALRARRGALFCFSTEHHSGEGWRLGATGRYAHCPAYITAVLEKTGWLPQRSRRERLRKEGGSWVTGDIYLAIRAA